MKKRIIIFSALLALCCLLTACNPAGIPGGKYYLKLSSGDLSETVYLEVFAEKVTYVNGDLKTVFYTLKDDSGVYRFVEDGKAYEDGLTFTYDDLQKSIYLGEDYGKFWAK